MRTYFAFVVPLILTLICMSACRERATSSGLKHISGELSRPNMWPLTAKGCTKSVASDGDELPAMSEYLRKIFAIVVENNKDVFVGAYAPENFCIRAVKSDEMNAYAHPSGNIVFLSKLVYNSVDDASVAADLTHELSHILMQHSALRLAQPGAEFVDHPRLVNDPAWAQAKQQVRDGSPELVEAEARLKKATEKREAFLSPVRKLLSPATRETEKTLQNALNEIKKKTDEVDRRVAEAQAKYNKFKESTDYKNLPPAVQKQLDDEFATQVGAISGTKDHLENAAYYFQGELDKFDIHVDNEISNALSKHLGGVLKKEWNKVSTEFKDARSSVRDIEKQQRGKFDAVSSQLLGYDYNPYNWMEAEADQVGLNLMLRMKVSPEGARNSFRGFLREYDSKGERVKKCDETYAAYKNDLSTPLPERGERTHPETCWRLINTHTEVVLHKDEYAPLLQNATQTVLVPGALDELKASK